MKFLSFFKGFSVLSSLLLFVLSVSSADAIVGQSFTSVKQVIDTSSTLNQIKEKDGLLYGYIQNSSSNIYFTPFEGGYVMMEKVGSQGNLSNLDNINFANNQDTIKLFYFISNTSLSSVGGDSKIHDKFTILRDELYEKLGFIKIFGVERWSAKIAPPTTDNGATIVNAKTLTSFADTIKISTNYDVNSSGVADADDSIEIEINEYPTFVPQRGKLIDASNPSIEHAGYFFTSTISVNTNFNTDVNQSALNTMDIKMTKPYRVSSDTSFESYISIENPDGYDLSNAVLIISSDNDYINQASPSSLKRYGKLKSSVCSKSETTHNTNIECRIPSHKDPNIGIIIDYKAEVGLNAGFIPNVFTITLQKTNTAGITFKKEIKEPLSIGVTDLSCQDTQFGKWDSGNFLWYDYQGKIDYFNTVQTPTLTPDTDIYVTDDTTTYSAYSQADSVALNNTLTPYQLLRLIERGQIDFYRTSTPVSNRDLLNAFRTHIGIYYNSNGTLLNLDTITDDTEFYEEVSHGSGSTSSTSYENKTNQEVINSFLSTNSYECKNSSDAIVACTYANIAHYFLRSINFIKNSQTSTIDSSNTGKRKYASGTHYKSDRLYLHSNPSNSIECQPQELTCDDGIFYNNNGNPVHVYGYCHGANIGSECQSEYWGTIANGDSKSLIMGGQKANGLINDVKVTLTCNDGVISSSPAYFSHIFHQGPKEGIYPYSYNGNLTSCDHRNNPSMSMDHGEERIFYQNNNEADEATCTSNTVTLQCINGVVYEVDNINADSDIILTFSITGGTTHSLSYDASSGDSALSIATGINNAINSDTILSNSNIIASAQGAKLNIESDTQFSITISGGANLTLSQNNITQTPKYIYEIWIYNSTNYTSTWNSATLYNTCSAYVGCYDSAGVEMSHNEDTAIQGYYYTAPTANDCNNVNNYIDYDIYCRNGILERYIGLNLEPVDTDVYLSCTDIKADCSLPSQPDQVDGQEISVYPSCSGDPITATCDNGNWKNSGNTITVDDNTNYIFNYDATCRQSCTDIYGTVDHGMIGTLYQSSTVNDCDNNIVRYTCQNGDWYSGTTPQTLDTDYYLTCNNNCQTADGQFIEFGNSSNLYNNATVPQGSQCNNIAINITCNDDDSVSGDGTSNRDVIATKYRTCRVQQGDNCIGHGSNFIASGSNKDFYTNTIDTSCTAINLTCDSSGNLGGDTGHLFNSQQLYDSCTTQCTYTVKTDEGGTITKTLLDGKTTNIYTAPVTTEADYQSTIITIQCSNKSFFTGSDSNSDGILDDSISDTEVDIANSYESIRIGSPCISAGGEYFVHGETITKNDGRNSTLYESQDISSSKCEGTGNKPFSDISDLSSIQCNDGTLKFFYSSSKPPVDTDKVLNNYYVNCPGVNKRSCSLNGINYADGSTARGFDADNLTNAGAKPVPNSLDDTCSAFEVKCDNGQWIKDTDEDGDYSDYTDDGSEIVDENTDFYAECKNHCTLNGGTKVPNKNSPDSFLSIVNLYTKPDLPGTTTYCHSQVKRIEDTQCNNGENLSNTLIDTCINEAATCLLEVQQKTVGVQQYNTVIKLLRHGESIKVFKNTSIAREDYCSDSKYATVFYCDGGTIKKGTPLKQIDHVSVSGSGTTSTVILTSDIGISGDTDLLFRKNDDSSDISASNSKKISISSDITNSSSFSISDDVSIYDDTMLYLLTNEGVEDSDGNINTYYYFDESSNDGDSECPIRCSDSRGNILRHGVQGKIYEEYLISSLGETCSGITTVCYKGDFKDPANTAIPISYTSNLIDSKYKHLTCELDSSIQDDIESAQTLSSLATTNLENIFNGVTSDIFESSLRHKSIDLWNAGILKSPLSNPSASGSTLKNSIEIHLRLEKSSKLGDSFVSTSRFPNTDDKKAQEKRKGQIVFRWQLFGFDADGIPLILNPVLDYSTDALSEDYGCKDSTLCIDDIAKACDGIDSNSFSTFTDTDTTNNVCEIHIKDISGKLTSRNSNPEIKRLVNLLNYEHDLIGRDLDDDGDIDVRDDDSDGVIDFVDGNNDGNNTFSSGTASFSFDFDGDGDSDLTITSATVSGEVIDIDKDGDSDGVTSAGVLIDLIDLKYPELYMFYETPLGTFTKIYNASYKAIFKNLSNSQCHASDPFGPTFNLTTDGKNITDCPALSNGNFDITTAGNGNDQNFSQSLESSYSHGSLLPIFNYVLFDD